MDAVDQFMALLSRLTTRSMLGTAAEISVSCATQNQCWGKRWGMTQSTFD